MASRDHPIARQGKPLSEKHGEEAAMGNNSTDVLSAARGAMIGIGLCLIIWVLMVLAVRAL